MNITVYEDRAEFLSEERFPELSEYGEGEFAILKNKIEKLILLLRHRTDELSNEKKLLAEFNALRQAVGRNAFEQ